MQRSDPSIPRDHSEEALQPTSYTTAPRLRVLFFVEGFTDIRFVLGLNEICDLTMIVPTRAYAESGLGERIKQSGIPIEVAEIGGGRLAFQLRSFAHLWKSARNVDLILAQEVLRGALNANLVGQLRRVPVVTYMNLSPLEYFRCRRERRQIGALRAAVGETLIRSMMTVNGMMAARAVALGSYLCTIASHYNSQVANGLYYGVDTARFRPATVGERMELRQRLRIPTDKFVIFFSSRVSHEKDPETVLRAVASARSRGLDAILLNLGGGYREFLDCACALKLGGTNSWIIGRPAVHPIQKVFEYFRASDAVVQASLAEGLGLSLAESLACGTPVVATAVGGMTQFDGYARLVPRRDAEAMARELLWIAANAEQAQAQALRGREYVLREWDSQKAFADLARILDDVVSQASRSHLPVDTRRPAG